MAVAERQGREKPVKIEQRKVKERSEEREREHIKGGAKFSLSLMRTLFLSLHPPPAPCAGALLHPLLFFQDGFSCYLLNEIEL